MRIPKKKFIIEDSVNNVIDALLIEWLRITKEQLDILLEEASDEEWDIITGNDTSYKNKRNIIQILKKYLNT